MIYCILLFSTNLLFLLFVIFVFISSQKSPFPKINSVWFFFLQIAALFLYQYVFCCLSASTAADIFSIGSTQWVLCWQPKARGQLKLKCSDVMVLNCRSYLHLCLLNCSRPSYLPHPSITPRITYTARSGPIVMKWSAFHPLHLEAREWQIVLHFNPQLYNIGLLHY